MKHKKKNIDNFFFEKYFSSILNIIDNINKKFTNILTEERHRIEIEKKYILSIFFSTNEFKTANIKKIFNKLLLKIIW